MFKPLSSAYSKALTNHLHNAQGLVAIKKGDFFPLFWEAWTQSFNKKDLVLKSFEATGIWPTNAEVILKRFTHSTPEQDSRESSTSVLIGKDWLKIETLVRSQVKDQTNREVKKLHRSLHHIAIQNDLLHAEVQNLTKALTIKKKQQKKSKPLDLQQRKEYHGRAVFYSPRKIREARARAKVVEQEKEKQELQKAHKKAEQALNKVRKIQEQEKKDREKIQKQQEKEKQNTKKPIQTPQKGKRKASKPPAKRQKKQSCVGGAAEAAVKAQGDQPRDPSPVRTTRGGRNIKLPQKFK
ncbi:hypothetical protein DM02DRAFT_607318 [Periconia macrospinosa]|uniref:Uncharacterized protein n=1 Tax=Periconia macrospinosa TaxID=97972 RepID=A0A2V1CY21_9PLEO|nr:hypothetical protein DM02DRAFT_607318 [Periconia macrospinosa]